MAESHLQKQSLLPKALHNKKILNQKVYLYPHSGEGLYHTKTTNRMGDLVPGDDQAVR